MTVAELIAYLKTFDGDILVLAGGSVLITPKRLTKLTVVKKEGDYLIHGPWIEDPDAKPMEAVYVG